MISDDPVGVRGLNFVVMIIISSSKNLRGADLDSEMKIRFSQCFHCMPQALASQKERKQLLIILFVWNTILSEFLPFSVHSFF